jgi:hypothetical protein
MRARMEGSSDIRGADQLGDIAYPQPHRNYDTGGAPMRRAGYTLTILRKDPMATGGSPATPSVEQGRGTLRFRTASFVPRVRDADVCTKVLFRTNAGRPQRNRSAMWLSEVRI